MFIYLFYQKYLIQPDIFWDAHHVGMLWGLAVLFDIMLLLVLYVALQAVLASGTGQRALDARDRLSGFARLLARIDRVFMVIAGLFLAAMVLTTFLSVTGRTFYRSIPDDITFAEWFMVALVALMLGVIQGRDEQIEVTAISDLQSYRVNLWLRLLGLGIGVAAVGRLAMVAVDRLPRNFLEITYGSLYQLPVWPARLVFAAGIGWWLARIAMQFVMAPAAIRCAARSDLQWLDLTPLMSRDGKGEPDIVEKLADQQDNHNEAGGARGT